MNVGVQQQNGGYLANNINEQIATQQPTTVNKMDVGSEDPYIYEGTSDTAFNLIFIDHDGSSIIKTIRGHDEDKIDYNKQLMRFLRRMYDPNVKTELENAMRSNNLITITENGTLVTNPVYDRSMVRLPNSNGIVENVTFGMAELEYGEDYSLNGLSSISDNLVYRADNKQIFGANYIGVDTTVDDLTNPNTPGYLQTREQMLENLDGLTHHMETLHKRDNTSIDNNVSTSTPSPWDTGWREEYDPSVFFIHNDEVEQNQEITFDASDVAPISEDDFW